MSILDNLRAQKQQGEQEWAAKQTEAQRQRDDDAARKREEEERRRSAESEKDRRKAEEMFASLPALVRAASALGLDAAVLADSFVEEKEQEGSLPITLNRRTYHLVGWQLSFYDMCRADRIPLTVVTERVDVAFKGVLHRTFNVLAVDLRNL